MAVQGTDLLDPVLICSEVMKPNQAAAVVSFGNKAKQIYNLIISEAL